MGRLAPHDVFFSQSPGIPTRNARFIVIYLSETLNRPADDTGQNLHPYYEIGKLMSETFRCVTVALLERAIRSFEMTNLWPFKQNPAVQSRSRSRWTFCLEQEPPGHFMRSGDRIRSWDIFPGLEPEPLKTLPVLHQLRGCGAGIEAAAHCTGPESEPLGHLSQFPFNWGWGSG